MGKELEAIKSICQKTFTFNTDSVLNVKSMPTCSLAGVFGGDDGSEPAFKEVLWNNVKKGDQDNALQTIGNENKFQCVITRLHKQLGK